MNPQGNVAYDVHLYSMAAGMALIPFSNARMSNFPKPLTRAFSRDDGPLHVPSIGGRRKPPPRRIDRMTAKIRGIGNNTQDCALRSVKFSPRFGMIEREWGGLAGFEASCFAIAEIPIAVGGIADGRSLQLWQPYPVSSPAIWCLTNIIDGSRALKVTARWCLSILTKPVWHGSDSSPAAQRICHPG